MHVDHHDLYTEFPEYRDAIDTLRGASGLFASLCIRHDLLTSKIETLEERDMPISDFMLEDMKKARVKMKDEIYQLLVVFRIGQKYPAC